MYIYPVSYPRGVIYRLRVLSFLGPLNSTLDNILGNQWVSLYSLSVFMYSKGEETLQLRLISDPNQFRFAASVLHDNSLCRR